MISSRQRALLAALILSALLLVGYYSIREPTSPPRSNTSTKIAQAKERLQHNVEEQNKHLKQALAAAKASLQSLTDAPAATASTLAPSPSETAPSEPKPKEESPDPTGFAYIFYATTDAYACSVLVNIHRLTHLLHTTIPIHVLAAPSVSAPYLAALRAANATLHVQDPPPMPARAVHYYRDSLLKLRAFAMHQFAPGLRRVMVLDADQLVLRNVDALFWTLPEVDLAAPRAYWLGTGAGAWLSSTFLLIGLSDRLWALVERAMEVNLSLTGEVRYDMDLVNAVLGETATVLGGEFVCLNSHWEDWNLPRWYHAERELNWTTIGLVNELAAPARADVSPGSRRVRSEAEEQKRQIFKSTDLPPEIPPTPAPAPAPLQPTNQNRPPSLPPSPRFPLTHPLALELQRLHATGAALLHFSAVGKPWIYTPEMVAQIKPDAHPLLAEQFGVWRDMAGEVCPGGLEGLDEVVLPGSVEGVVGATATGAEVDVAPPRAGFGVPVAADVVPAAR